jgi:hypothetical protein
MSEEVGLACIEMLREQTKVIRQKIRIVVRFDEPIVTV